MSNEIPALTASDRRDVEEALTLTRQDRARYAGNLALLIREAAPEAYIAKLTLQVEACDRHIRIKEAELAA